MIGNWCLRVRGRDRTDERVVVRDQTTVRYEVGEGVAPHVDGKHVTVLICLEEPLSGGRTVFPDDGIAVAPKKGCAFVYRSCGELVHFAEAVGTKWVWTSPAALFLVSARGVLVEHTAAGEVACCG